jgi:preprotein translocase subunit SecD
MCKIENTRQHPDASVRGAAGEVLETIAKEILPMQNVTLVGLALVLLLPALACGGLPANSTHAVMTSPPLLEVRLVLTERAEEGIRLDFERGTLNLGQEPIITDSDFVAVRATFGQDATGQDVLFLTVQCTAEADARMRSISGRHINGRIAILFDGEVRSVPVVRSAVGCSRTTMGFPASEGEAEQLAERVRTQWPDG